MHHSKGTTSSVSNDPEEPPQKKKLHAAQSSLLQLPNELSVNCLARVPRCYHPSVSMVSPALRRLIASPQIYAERSLLRRTENVLYVSLSLKSLDPPRWYTLNLKPFGQVSLSHCLVPVPTTFPFVPSWETSMVAFGSEIYVIGGCVNDRFVSTAFVIECPSYTCRYLPNMKQKRGCAAAGIVQGKLYVIGGCDRRSPNWVEAFDLKTETWETVTTSSGPDDVKVCKKMIRSFVVDEKMYLMDRNNSFVYGPREGSLEKDVLLNRDWSVSSCVIDNKLYSFGRDYRYKMWEFDPVARVWSEVKGVGDIPGMRGGSKLVNYGGRLVFLCRRGDWSTEIWCTEIELERKEGGEVWGKILWSSLMLASEDTISIVRSLAVSF
ncbi:unnamed protein product [Eruca vesicaria subsp. sativa]|uniref:F-box domain-containing protein n=1 Tax=Eruca vesicaria subsp. sativa TaxID=29727 RepID=A0ABC8KTM8_ERUVS|nr:unnamed protein product [Eruca vesicaria subsp. sativa]